VKAVVQRVLSASVTVEGRAVGKCGRGLLLLVAAHKRDSDAQAVKLADRIVNLRIFNDEAGKMNLALRDAIPESGENDILAVSNFTVYGETEKSRRPSFVDAAPYSEGERLFDLLVQALKDRGMRVGTGVFGADMKVELINDGPVTVILEASPPKDEF
jgi:D-tyrosyl-tRNA(Tyr) deacylase